MVTSQKMIEKEMGNRGSKSDHYNSNKNKSVKEQRVDGSWFGYKPTLRCTLLGGESRYRIRIPSKQLNVKKLSTFNYPSNVNPWVWSGLIDAEGSFSIIVDKNKKRTLGSFAPLALVLAAPKQGSLAVELGYFCLSFCLCLLPSAAAGCCCYWLLAGLILLLLLQGI
jgi:hypothetical protein